MSKKSGNMKLFTGILLGAGLGLMFAPHDGSKTRKILKEKLDEFSLKLKDVDVKEVQNELSDKIMMLKQELSELDKEKAMALTEEGLKKLQKKGEELYSYAKEKGTPLLEKAALEVKDQIYKYAKVVVSNYEEKPKAKNTKTTKKSE